MNWSKDTINKLQDFMDRLSDTIDRM